MPLIRMEKWQPGSAWGLWRINEGEEALANLVSEVPGPEIKSPPKRAEYLAGRALLHQMVEGMGFDSQGMTKDEFGKPWLVSGPAYMSLAHSFPYVAARLDARCPVGIDVEQPKTKLLRVAPRVLSAAEQTNAGQALEKHCVYWSAKEALYKWYGRKGLHFARQLWIDPFSLQRAGRLQGHIKTNEGEWHLGLRYCVLPDAVVVYTRQ